VHHHHYVTGHVT